MSLEIINSARCFARVPTIEGLADNSVDARDSSAEYSKALRWLVEETEWNCLNTTICPDELPDPECCDIPNGFSYAFRYPDQAMRIAAVCIKDCGSKCDCKATQSVSWRVVRMKGKMSAQKAIVTNCRPVKIEYIALPEECEVDEFPQNMKDALTYRLAEVFFQKSGDNSNAEKYRQLSMDKLVRASANDRQQGDPDDRLEDEGFLIAARCW